MKATEKTAFKRPVSGSASASHEKATTSTFQLELQPVGSFVELECSRGMGYGNLYASICESFLSSLYRASRSYSILAISMRKTASNNSATMGVSAQQQVFLILKADFAIEISLAGIEKLLGRGLSLKDAVKQLVQVERADGKENNDRGDSNGDEDEESEDQDDDEGDSDHGNEEVTRLDLFLTLLEFSQQNPDILKDITKDHDITTIRQAALSKFPAPSLSTKSLRAHLYAMEPTAAVIGLLKSGTLTLPDDKAMEVADALERLLGSSFDLLRMPVAQFCEDNLTQEDEKAIHQVRDLLCSVQRLAVIVKNPEDIGVLFTAGFTSAHSIIQKALPSFVALIKQHGGSVADPRNIYSHAASIDFHNEQVVSLVSQQYGHLDVRVLSTSRAGVAAGADFFAAPACYEIREPTEVDYEEAEDANLSPIDDDEQLSISVDPSSSREKNEAPQIAKEKKELADGLKPFTSGAISILSDVNMPEDPDSLSVLSPTAYLVDLLQMLKGVLEDKPTKNEAKERQVARNLLTRVLLRRPDIQRLQLSIANQDVEIPYIDLANEVMESTAWHFGYDSASALVQSHDMASTELEELNAREPQQINYSVYSELVCKQVAPLHQFPYNQAIESTRNLMKSFTLSRFDLLEAFCTEHAISNLGVSVDQAGKVMQRIKAAERLNLAMEDFILLTAQDFSGNTPSKITTAHALWGYSCERDMLDTSKDDGLYFVEEQLLPRAGVQFATLVEVIDSHFFNGQLVFNPHHAREEPSTEPPELALDLKSYRLCSKGSLTLTVNDCERLNLFLRLLKRSGWPIVELSESLLVFSSPLANKPRPQESKIHGDVLVNLAALADLSQLTGIGRRRLLSLWTEKDSSSLLSLLPLEFELARLGGIDEAFSKGLEDGQWAADESLTAHAAIVSIYLNMDFEDVTRLIAAQKVSDLLNWQSLGVLHRFSLLGKILKVSVDEYLRLSDENSLGLDKLLIGPVETLRFLKRWQSISKDASGESILKVFQPTDSSVERTKALGFLREAIGYFTMNKLWVDVATRPNNLAEVVGYTRVTKAITNLMVELIPGLSILTLKALSQYTEAVVRTVCEDVNMLSEIPCSKHLYIEGVLLASSSCNYTFVIEGSKNIGQCEVTFNGQKLALRERTGAGKLIFVSEPVMLDVGSWHSLKAKVDNSMLKLEPQGPSKSQVSFVSEAVVSRLGRTLRDVGISTWIITWKKLEKAEVEYFIPGEHGNYLSRLELLEQITIYNELKPRSRGLLSFLSNKDTEGLTSQITSLTTLPLKLIEELLEANYPKLEETQKRTLLTNLGGLRTLLDQANFMTRANLLKVPPQLLIDCAIGEVSSTIYSASDKLWSSVRSLTLSSEISKVAFKKANELHRTSRRDALIHYLLQQDHIQKANIKDADGLFEYFLIDVQMGPNQTTTRIVQAISSVQFYVERCLYNLENGISPSRLDKEQWSSYLGTYRKWEANRKVFLYPENYIDPTLRDNKTELFKELEVSMAQKQLDEGSLLQLIKNYIYGVHDLGSLQIESYYRETLNGGETRFHFFARTKSSPPKFYYRTMDYTVQKIIEPSWSPWEIIQVDIPIYEVDDLGNALDHSGSYLIPFVWKNEVHLVTPQLVLKPGETNGESALATVPQGPTGLSAPQGTKTWGRYW